MGTILRVAVLVISETAYKDPSTDKCAPVLKDVFASAGTETVRWEVANTSIVSDDVLAIQKTITTWTDTEDFANVVITSGGTGFTGKDMTPEAVNPLLHKHAPGLLHGMLAASLQVTPFAMMARPVAGVRNKSLILTLPGSPKGAKENLEAVIKLLAHACQQAAGAGSRTLHAGGTRRLEQEAGLASPPGSHSHDHSHGHDHHHHHGAHGAHAPPKPHTAPSARPSPNDPTLGPVLRARESPYPMLPVSAALDLIGTHVPRPTTTTLPLTPAVIGTVLAAPVTAAEAVPAFRASIVDGYAVRAPCKAGVYAVGLVRHAQAPRDAEGEGGEGGEAVLAEGSVARITTGAPLPVGADAVVMVEDTRVAAVTDDGAEEREVEILTSDVVAGENVREVGSDVQAGEVVLGAGEGISAIGGEFGLLASVGTREVEVYRKPVVGVLSTGDEIVSHDREGTLRLGEVRDTNRPTLLAAVRNSGFEAVDLGIASDTPGALEEKLREAMRAVDVVVTTGGVSMGELDLLKPTIERSLGGTIHFGRVSMKPGKPTTFATVPFKNNEGKSVTRVVFSLPGNPASAVVTYHLFVLPALHQMSGIKPVGLPKVMVRMEERVRCDAKRQEYVRAIVASTKDGLAAKTTGGQRSSRIGSFKGANALVIMPVREGWVEQGDQLGAMMMGSMVPQI